MPLIETEALTRVFRAGDQEVVALAGVDLLVEDGEFVAITGASGSGKSSLLYLLGCLDRPSSGRYRLAGEEVAGLGRGRLAELRNRCLGFVFQAFHLLPRASALENVELPLLYAGVPARRRHELARVALDRVGLAARSSHTPAQLSGGQQQRVAVARAIVQGPRLLLADEPTGNLDTVTSLEVMDLFKELHGEGLSIVMVTHEPDIAACASRLLVMRDGRVVSDRRQAASAGGAS
jgi:putative ABC transport system ATP-binding protein